LSILLWWRERLVERCPLRGPALEKIDYKPAKGDTWHAAVARQALFNDYLGWHQDVFLRPYNDVQYFQDNPQRVPNASDSLEFFTTMAPLTYLVGKKKQTRAYKVNKNVCHEGQWIVLKKNRYFIKLCDWHDHCIAYETYTGHSLQANVVFFEAKRAQKLADTADAAEQETERKRKIMVEAMSRD
jgi:hypothetical protein